MPTATWFSHKLLPWYRENRRSLPWRTTRDPYRIWLSEVILQQTRVEQGTAYYLRFVERYPTVEALARASEEEVLRLWQGLGYYSRGRNLLAAARQVAEDHGGVFPEQLDGLWGLKGVGRYTAAAIASIAYQQPEAVVDGNVYRVLSRVFGIGSPIDQEPGRREFAALAQDLLDRSAPGDHNQAVMELGATVCMPRRPLCDRCPLAGHCVALCEDRIGTLPVKLGRTKVRQRWFQFIHLPTDAGDGLFLQKRGEGDIWQGLYQLPLVASEGPMTAPGVLRSLARDTGIREDQWHLVKGATMRHVLTHQRIEATFWKAQVRGQHTLPPDWLPVAHDAVTRYPLPRLIDRYLKGNEEV